MGVRILTPNTAHLHYNTCSPRQLAENIEAGKTFQWFKYAARHFPRSDWIFKVDTDTAVNWTAVTNTLLASSGWFGYFGHVMDHDGCGRASFCPPIGCKNLRGDCWIYMQGGFYGVSTGVAQLIMECPYAQRHKNGLEDLVFGRMVNNCMKDVDVDILTMGKGQGWCHNKNITLTQIREGGRFPATCFQGKP